MLNKRKKIIQTENVCIIVCNLFHSLTRLICFTGTGLVGVALLVF